MFAGPSIMADQISHQYGGQQVGVATPLTGRFYAISVERKVKHPAVLAIRQVAREQLFVRQFS